MEMLPSCIDYSIDCSLLLVEHKVLWLCHRAKFDNVILTFSAEKWHLRLERSWRGMIKPLLPKCWGEFPGILDGHSKTGLLWPPGNNQGTLPYALYSLPDLLLYPSRRFEEYLHLLYALRLHTPAGHVDRGDLTIAIDQIKKYKGYIDQVGCWHTREPFNVHAFVVFSLEDPETPSLLW